MTLAGFVTPQSVASLVIRGHIKVYSNMFWTHCGNHLGTCLGRKRPGLDHPHPRSCNRHHLKHQESYWKMPLSIMIGVSSLTPMMRGNDADPVEYRPLGKEWRLALNPQDSWHIAGQDLILHCNQTPPESFAPHLFFTTISEINVHVSKRWFESRDEPPSIETNFGDFPTISDEKFFANVSRSDWR